MYALKELLRSLLQIFHWWIVISPWDRGVRARLGKHVCILGPGVHLKIPWADRIYTQPIRRRVSVISIQTITTLDNKTVTLSGSLGYAITDLLRLYQTLHDAEDTLEAEVQGLISDFVVRRNLAECTPDLIQLYVVRSLHLDRYGLGDVEFHIVQFAVVKTFRLIQGDIRTYKHGSSLDTSGDDE